MVWLGCVPGEAAGAPGLCGGQHDAARSAGGGRVSGPPDEAVAAGRLAHPLPGGLQEDSQHPLHPAHCAALCPAAHGDPPGGIHAPWTRI